MRVAKLAFVTAVTFLVAVPAFAQKAQDTLRVAVNNPFNILSTYDLPVDEGLVYSHEIYDYMMSYDEHTQKFVPGLAKSWKRIDDKTLEFELRDDVKFHNGDAFDANDVKETLSYVIDPKSKITFATSYNWVKEVEVMGPHTVRFHNVDAIATDLIQVAYRFQIYDGKLLSKMEDKGDYGRVSPVGTGIYKVTQLDKNKGVIVERNDAYNVVPKEFKTAKIKRVHGIPMPDRQTQVAQMLTGGVDLLRNVTPDTAKELAGQKDIKVTYVKTLNLMYMALDSMNLSGNKALSDPRVRQAIFMGIDRENLIKYIIPGGEVAERIDADCFKATMACKYTTKPPAYDPAGAKKLLAEAGYPDGLDLTYVIYAPNEPIGVAIAGDLRKIGVRVGVQPTDIALYRRMQGEGKLQAWSILYPTGTYPDASAIFAVLFTGPAAKYYNDSVIDEQIRLGLREFDPAKRADIYAKAFDRINEMHYHLPISSVPDVYVHSKDVKIAPDALSVGQTSVVDYAWN